MNNYDFISHLIMTALYITIVTLSHIIMAFYLTIMTVYLINYDVYITIMNLYPQFVFLSHFKLITVTFFLLL